eukprot:596363-Amphidinium_carterae.1
MGSNPNVSVWSPNPDFNIVRLGGDLVLLQRLVRALALGLCTNNERLIGDLKPKNGKGKADHNACIATFKAQQTLTCTFFVVSDFPLRNVQRDLGDKL